MRDSVGPLKCKADGSWGEKCYPRHTSELLAEKYSETQSHPNSRTPGDEMTSNSITQNPLIAGNLVKHFVDTCPNDNYFGPFSECRLDFTLHFEQVYLSGIPSALFLLAFGYRRYRLRKQDQKIVSNHVGFLKLLFTIAYLLSQFTALVYWMKYTSLQNAKIIFVAIINLVVAVVLVPLSYLEHSRSVNPSAVLEAYLIISVLFGLPEARTLLIIKHDSSLAGILVLGICFKLMLLFLESRSKMTYLKIQYQNLPPETLSGIISRSFLWWLNGIFTARSMDFYREYLLDHDLLAENAGQKLQIAWDERTISRNEKRFSLIWAMVRGLGGSFAHVLFPRLCLIAFTFAQPFLITSVLELLQNPDDEYDYTKGQLLVVATVLIYLGISVSALHSKHFLNRFIAKFRSAAVSVIYKKTLLLQDGGYDTSSAVTLMGADVDRIAFCLEELNECWSRLIEIGIGLPLLTRKLGWVSVIPLIVVGLSTIGSSVVAKLIASKQKTWSDATQRRIKATTSMLKEMKSIKMMGLTHVLGGLVQEKRVEETKKMEGWAWIMVWLNVFANFPVMLAPAATFGAYAIQAAIRGTHSLNTTQAFTSLALISLVSHPASRLLSAIPNIAASVACFDRIQAFLVLKPSVDSRKVVEKLQENDNIAIIIKDASFSPTQSAEFAVKNVNLSFPKGSVTIIAGQVGTGKTTLLRAILGEIECASGIITVCDRNISYCAQSPWLINGSIKEAICGFKTEDFDETWYQTVLTACELQFDLLKLSAGDRTIIGSRGAGLSGGQKQRIAMARAIYAKKKILLLDDVLSSLDGHTENNVVKNLLERSSGARTGLLRKLGCTVVLVTHSAQVLPLADQVYTIDAHGKITQATSDETVKHIPGVSKNSEVLCTDTSKNEDNEIKFGETEAEIEAKDLERKSGDIAVYKYYYRFIGTKWLVIFLLFVLLNVGSSSFSQIWLKWWTEHGGKQVALYANVYLVLAVGYSVGMGGYAWAIAVVIGPSTGRKLHSVLLDTVLRSPQSFFTSTNLGSILNRFVQDMSLIEGQLAYGVLAAVSNLFSTLAEAALIATGSPFAILALPFLFVVMYYLQKVYLRTSRQLRYLELENRSPVYSQFLETLDGLTTIRAFGWEKQFLETFNKRSDESQKPYYLMFCIQDWLGVVLDLIAAGMAVMVVSLALGLRHWTSAGLLGVAMNNVLSFNLSLSAFLSGWTVLETSLGAIARLEDFESETEVEEKPGDTLVVPPPNWPSQGAIEFESVSVEYNNSIKALKNISLSIPAGQHVSICGRTGSGKSTLLSTVLRLQNLTSGSIKIDSLDLSHLPRLSIRRQITTIPQEPFQLDGSVRFNMDPFSHSIDLQIISTLTKVDLWPILLPRGGLDAPLLPDMLSKGQLQLFALARALLRKSKVVLMDEATSSIDEETARKIDRIVRGEFRESTVLKIAHRQETILCADMVVVLEGGEIVEQGEPDMLMRKEGSKLSGLFEKSDQVVAVI